LKLFDFRFSISHFSKIKNKNIRKEKKKEILESQTMFSSILTIVALLALVGTTSSAPCQLTSASVKSVVNAYQTAQNNLDAKSTASLFTINAKLYMPVGVGQRVRRPCEHSYGLQRLLWQPAGDQRDRAERSDHFGLHCGLFKERLRGADQGQSVHGVCYQLVQHDVQLCRPCASHLAQPRVGQLKRMKN
jgi:hypothetical protein